jgi:hypothetical protein
MRIFLGALFIAIISGSQAHGCMIGPCPDPSVGLILPSQDQGLKWMVRPNTDVPPPPHQQNQVDPRCLELTYEQIVTTPGCIITVPAR